MAKKRFILKQLAMYMSTVYLNYEETAYTYNHTNDLQLAIQSTILILQLLIIGASDCATLRDLIFI